MLKSNKRTVKNNHRIRHELSVAFLLSVSTDKHFRDSLAHGGVAVAIDDNQNIVEYSNNFEPRIIAKLDQPTSMS